jgi:phage tail-like protein
MPETATSTNNPGNVNDPYVTFEFCIEIAGIVHAWFQECSGMQATTEVFEYKEGGLNGYSHKLPGRTSWGNITLKRGLTDSTEMWEWVTRFIAAKDKSAETKDVSVVQLDPEGDQLYRWDLAEAFPVKWSGPSFNSTQSAVSIETFEIAFSTLKAMKV